MTNEERLVDLLSRVLSTCELNLDEIEPETRAVCQEAAEFLADNYEPGWRDGWKETRT